jgi:hypothetical protein
MLPHVLGGLVRSERYAGRSRAHPCGTGPSPELLERDIRGDGFAPQWCELARTPSRSSLRPRLPAWLAPPYEHMRERRSTCLTRHRTGERDRGPRRGRNLLASPVRVSAPRPVVPPTTVPAADPTPPPEERRLRSCTGARASPEPCADSLPYGLGDRKVTDACC